MKTTKIIFFDDVCILCNRFVRIVLKNDKNKTIQFSPLQSDFSARTLKMNHIDSSKMNTVAYIHNDKIYFKSLAVLKIITSLKGLWKLSYILYIIPRFLADMIYDYIANKRYFIFGKMKSCMIPPKEMQDRFID